MTGNILLDIVLVLFICLVILVSWRMKGRRKPRPGAGLVTPEVIPRRSNTQTLEEEHRLP